MQTERKTSNPICADLIAYLKDATQSVEDMAHYKVVASDEYGAALFHLVECMSMVELVLDYEPWQTEEKAHEIRHFWETTGKPLIDQIDRDWHTRGEQQ